VRVHVVGFERRSYRGLTVRFHEPPQGLPGWPEPATTDDDGGFVLRGLGPDMQVDLQVHDPRFAPQWLTLRTGKTEQAKAAVLSLVPPRTLAGRVVCADTGRPLAGTRLVVGADGEGAYFLPGRVVGRTDAEG